VAGVADQLPVEVDSFHIRVLEAEEENLLQEDFHQRAIAAIEDFGSDGLDTLQVVWGYFSMLDFKEKRS